MALSIRSQTFQETLNEILTSEEDKDNKQILQERGVDEEDFLSAYNNEYIPLYKETVKETFGDPDIQTLSSEQKEELQSKLDEKLIVGSDSFDPGRTTAKLVGGIGRGLIEAIDTAADQTEIGRDVTDFISDKTEEYIPESARKYLSEMFDPYAGLDTSEDTVATIAGLITGGGLIVKGTQLATRALPFATPATRSFVSKLKRKGIKTIGKPATKVATAATYGAGAGVAYTAAEPLIGDVRQLLIDYDIDPTGMSRGEMYSTYYSKIGPKNLAFDAGIGAATLGALPVIKAVGKTYKGTKLDRFLKENLTSQRGVDNKTFSAAIKRNGASSSALRETEGLNKDFIKEIKNNPTLKAIPKDQLDEVINKALEGNQNASQLINQISPELSGILSKMRNNIDTLSSTVSNNLVGSSQLKATIDSNNGIYLNTSYNVFDDPVFRNELVKRVKSFKGSDKIVQDAANYIKSNVSGVNDTEAKRMLLAMIKESPADQVKKELGSLSKLFTTGPSGVFRPKEKNMPKELKAFFGEVRDPATRYSKTIEKLSRISAESDFIKEVGQNLVSKGLAKSGKKVDTLAWEEASDLIRNRLERVMGREAAQEVDLSTVAGQLDGLYVDPTYAKIMREGLTDWTDTANSTLGKFFGTFLKLKGASQAAKTVYNPSTHAANITGQAAILFANGMIPIGKEARKAGEATLKSLTGQSNEKLGQYLGKLNSLGITSSNLTTSMIRRNLNAAGVSPLDWMDKIGLNRVKNAGKKINEKLTDVYQAEDDVFKIMHFEKTKNYLRKADPNIGEDQLDILAAQRTRDLMPNYAQVSKLISGMRSLPLGDFLSFPAEMIRTSKNLAKYTLKDATSGNAVLQKEAAKKLAGMTSIGLLPGAAMEYSKQAHGITNDEEDAINTTAPAFEAFSNRIYMSGLNTDKNNHKGVNYLRLGSLDPYDYLKSMAAATHQAINSIGLNIDDNDNLTLEIANRPELNQAALSLFENQLAPFIAPSMITDAAGKLLLSNKPVGEAFVPSSDFIGSGLTSLGVPDLLANTLSLTLDPFTPGFMNFVKKKQEYNQGQGMRLKSKATINPSEVDIKGLFGLGTKRLDLTAGLNYQLQPLEGQFKNAGKKVSKEIENLGSTSESIYNAYLSGNKDRFKAQEEMKAVLQAYRSLGFSNDDIMNALAIKKGVPSQVERLKTLYQTENNQFIPLQLNQTDYIMNEMANRKLPTEIDTLYESLLDTNITPLPEYQPVTPELSKPRDVYGSIIDTLQQE